MKKTEYLEQVKEFTTWLARHLGDGSGLRHHYRSPRAADPIRFTNLADAMRKYAWPIATAVRLGAKSDQSLAANTLVLARLQNALSNAKTDAEMRDACIAVMKWGGVVNGNVLWLKENTAGLKALVHQVQHLLQQDDDDMALLTSDLRFNAGMTKVYSLLLDNFIIYDSRVAAALSWFVMSWVLESKGNAAAVPEALRFPCMPPKEGPNPKIRKVRNAGTNSLQFPDLNNRPRLHAHWNLRASWLLEAVLKECQLTTEFHKAPQPLRAVEAALFMWGYDLGDNLPRHPLLPAAA